MDVRLQSFAHALESFSYLANADIPALSATLDPRLIDGLQNGKAQKKTHVIPAKAGIQRRLRTKTLGPLFRGDDKTLVYKSLFACNTTLAGYSSEDDYLALIQAIDDRNKLSHIYEQKEFDSIIQRLPAYAELLQRVFKAMQK